MQSYANFSHGILVFQAGKSRFSLGKGARQKKVLIKGKTTQDIQDRLLARLCNRQNCVICTIVGF